MLVFLKLLLSLVIGLVCTAAGVAAGVGVAFCLLRDEDGGPGVAAALCLCALIGLVVGLALGAAGAAMFWRRVGVPVVSLPPVQGDTAGAVWPPPPRQRP